MIKQIKFVSIPVRDQNRALDFYTDKLGFTIITDQPFDEKQHWIELRIPKAETRVVLFTPDGDEKRIGSFMNMSYTCDDIDKTYAELQKRGVEFEGPPQKQPWGTYAMFTIAKEISSSFRRTETHVASDSAFAESYGVAGRDALQFRRSFAFAHATARQGDRRYKHLRLTRPPLQPVICCRRGCTQFPWLSLPVR